MADPLSIAASVAGLVSLGLQICSSTTNYLDAIKYRDRELAFARRHVRNLETIMEFTKELQSRLQTRHQQPLASVHACLESSKIELKALEGLVVELSNGGSHNPSFVGKAKDRKKKLAYAFNRPKLVQLEDRLGETVTALQIALQTLGIDISVSDGEVLRTIKTRASENAANILATHSQLDKIDTRVKSIHGELPEVRRLVEDMVPTIVGSNIDSTRIVRDDMERNYGFLAADIAMIRDQNESILNALLKTDDKGMVTPESILGKVISKPGSLKLLCDRLNIDHSATEHQRVCLGQQRGQLMLSRNGSSNDTIHRYVGRAACTCRPRRKLNRSQMVWGMVQVYHDNAHTERHLPTCEFYQSTNNSERVFGVRYTGLASLLNKAIHITFAMRSGAGAWSLSPCFTYYATVDSTKAPAFQVIEQLRRCLYYQYIGHKPLEESRYEHLLNLGSAKIGKLFREGKASPNDVNILNENLMHAATSLAFLSKMPLLSYKDFSNTYKDTMLRFLESLWRYGVPSTQYCLRGHTALMPMNYLGDWVTKAADVLFSREDEVPLITNKPLGRIHERHFYFHRIRMQIQSSVLAETYGCGPLSLAVLAGDLDQVQSIILKSPSSVCEKNCYGQTPLHLAVTRPSCLEILLEGVDENILNEPDDGGDTAIDYAVYSSKQSCRKNGSRRCRKCDCSKSASILLKADCAILLNPEAWDRWTTRCRTKYVKGLKNRRERLKQLALGIFSPLEIDSLSLGNSSVLDANCSRVVHLLVEKGIHIPAALEQRVESPFEEPCGAVYHFINKVDDAESFFRAGFHDIDELNDDGLPPIVVAGWNITYLAWLVDHGADLLRRLQPKLSTLSGSNIPGSFSAHYVFGQIGNTLKSLDGVSSTSANVIHSLNSKVLSVDLIDDCQCRCLCRGCTPFIRMLRGALGHLTGSKAMFQIADWFPAYLRVFMPDLQTMHLKEAARYFTFISLDIQHTCGYATYFQFGCTSFSDRDIREMEEEQANLLDLLEKLVHEFYEKLDEFGHDNISDTEHVISFWGGYWLDRMREEIEKLDAYVLTEVERRNAEKIGVIWDDDGHGVPARPEPELTFEYFMQELDKIVPD